MSDRCGVAHPDRIEVSCRAKGDHADHVSGPYIWTNTEWIEAQPTAPVRRGTALQRIRAAARRAEVQAPIGPPRTGIPNEAREAWNRDEWMDYAHGEFFRFITGRAQSFTTPEDFWPLIVAPREKRALSIVVQAALRKGQIEESGEFKRLRGVYRTSDGVEFAMNKVVPIYRSLLG